MTRLEIICGNHSIKHSSQLRAEFKELMLKLIEEIEKGEYGMEADFALSDLRQKVNEQ